jgi:hypothetical protein
MTAATAYAGLLTALKAVHGSTATLVGNGWRKDVIICLQAGWSGAMAGGIGIERIEPVALVDTADVTAYDFDNGWTLEVGDDIYRVTARAKDDMGATLLTLAKL